MQFVIVDQDRKVRSRLAQFIEKNKLGEFINEQETTVPIDRDLLNGEKKEYLTIDLFMPVAEGVEVVRDFNSFYNNEVVFVSRVKDQLRGKFCFLMQLTSLCIRLFCK